MAKIKRTNSKKTTRPRAKLTKTPAPAVGGSASNEDPEPKGIRRAFFKLEELGRRLRSQKENLVIDWDLDVLKDDKVKDGDKPLPGEILESAGTNTLPVLDVLAVPAQSNSPRFVETTHLAAPPPTPAAHRTVLSSPGNIFINGGQSHRLSSSRHCPSSPPNPGGRIAIQNSDSEFDEDMIVLSTLENSVERPLPFCCHEDLLDMTQPQLIEVANVLNASLPAALAIKTVFGYGYELEDLRRNIERVVGIRTVTDQTPAHHPQNTNAPSTGSGIPSSLRRDVAPSAFTEDFNRTLDFPSPPTSPLARTKYSQFSASAVSPRTFLARLDEEESLEVNATHLGLAAIHQLPSQGVSPLLPNPWDDPAMFADVSNMNPTDDETDTNLDGQKPEGAKSQHTTSPSSSSVSSEDPITSAEPPPKVRRTQSMRVSSVSQQEAAPSSGRVLRSQSQRTNIERTSLKARRTSVGALAGRDTSFITTRRPSYRFKPVAATEPGPSSLKRSQSERQRQGRAVTKGTKDLARRSTISGVHAVDGPSDNDTKPKRGRASMAAASTGSKRKRKSAQSNEVQAEGKDL